MNSLSAEQDLPQHNIADQTPALRQDRMGATTRVTVSGSWTLTSIHLVDGEMRKLAADPCETLELDCRKISNMDTGGAWLIVRLTSELMRLGKTVRVEIDNKKHVNLIGVVGAGTDGSVADEPAVADPYNPLESIGHLATEFWRDFMTGCYLLGSSIRGRRDASTKSGLHRAISIVHQIDHMGLRAIPVIVLMSFLIGAIIAQQGAYQLKFYGEELLTVYLVGVLHFREIGVLLTAIMVAGRTGSAITAEIGTMKMREEIDALDVIGLNPVGVLIFPRLVALVIVLPILTLISDVAGMAGAIVIGDLYVGITPTQFLITLQEGVSIDNLMVGLIKAPFMALMIGTIAAIEGLKVGGSAESLGQGTTRAVVRAIFAVVVMDGLFAIFFSAIDL